MTMQTDYGRSKYPGTGGRTCLRAGVLLMVAAMAGSAAVAKPARFDFLVVPEDEPWTAAIAAPVAAIEKAGGQMPLLIALGSPPTREAEQLVELAAPKHPLVLATVTEPKLGRALEHCDRGDGSRFRPGAGQRLGGQAFLGTAAASRRRAARRRRGRPLRRRVAARMSIPLLLRERTESRVSLGQVLQDLGVEEALAAVADADHAPLWTKSRGQYNIKVLATRAVQDRLVEAIGRDAVRTVVVARVPEKRSGVGQERVAGALSGPGARRPHGAQPRPQRPRWPRPR